MNWKRLAAMGLGVAMSLSLLCVPAGALTLTDIEGHWAKVYIEDMVAEGLTTGYEDSTYRPENVLSIAEGLAFCARSLQLEKDVSAAILEKHADDLDELLGEDYSYFRTEFAICLEVGIVTRAEFKALAQEGKLSQDNPMPKQDLARYLVRAMGLDKLAESQSSYPLGFADAGEIQAINRPSVYLLNMYGIVVGDDNNVFNADVTRAIMATMLSRILDFKDERGIALELPAFTDYNWYSGTVQAVTTSDLGVRVVTLDNGFEEETISLLIPDEAEIYENNMRTNVAALRAGRYVRVNLDEKGAVDEVRLYGELTEVRGAVTTLAEDGLLLNMNGIPKTVELNRFTLVEADGVVCTMDAVDLESGYTTATALVDDYGRAVALQLQGGTTKYIGLYQDREKVAGSEDLTLKVNSFDGVLKTYHLPADVTISVNGVPGKNSAINNYQGNYVTIRTSNDTGEVTSVDFETASVYVQGTIRAFIWQADTPTVSINDLDTGKFTTYNVHDEVKVSYEGEAVAFKNVNKGWYVTARLANNVVEELLCYPGTVTVEGVLTKIDYSAVPTVALTVYDEAEEQTYVFKLDITDLPNIRRDDDASSIDKLRTGDEVAVVLSLNEVTSIAATSQAATLTGTIQAISQTLSGNSMTVLLSDGTEATYTVGTSVSITQDGKTVAFTSLKAGYQVALRTTGDTVASIEVTGATAAASDEMKGMIIYVNEEEKTILFQETGSETPVSISVKGARFMSTGGTTLKLADLSAGDYLTVYGTYNISVFEATLVLR